MRKMTVENRQNETSFFAIFATLKMRTFYFSFVALFFSFSTSSQEEAKTPLSVEADFFYGNIWEHNPEIQHLITDHPTGFHVAFNFKSFGVKEWERRYNYPDWGFSAVFQNMQNKHLGEVVGVYSHINWYLLNRHLVLGVGQGIGYASNPYDSERNYQNNAYGSHLMAATFFKGNYIRENIWNGFGFQIGMTIFHYSNGNLKAPNKSTNTIAVNAGVNYIFDSENFPEYRFENDSLSRTYAEPICFSFEFRSGANESDVIGIGRRPFYIFSAFADKRINYKSTFQAGVDFFVMPFLKDYIEYRSVAYPEDGLSGNEDYKRVGVFVGHEWRFNRVAMIAQLGYYVYYPFDYENRIYNRLGIKRYLMGDNLYASVGVKAHWAKAEAVEFGIGYRL